MPFRCECGNKTFKAIVKGEIIFDDKLNIIKNMGVWGLVDTENMICTNCGKIAIYEEEENQIPQSIKGCSLISLEQLRQ